MAVWMFAKNSTDIVRDGKTVTIVTVELRKEPCMAYISYAGD
jgi:hypothetical protein